MYDDGSDGDGDDGGDGVGWTLLSLCGAAAVVDAASVVVFIVVVRRSQLNITLDVDDGTRL